MAIQLSDIDFSETPAKSAGVASLLPQARAGKPLHSGFVGGSGRRQGRYKYWTKDEIEELKHLAERHVRVTALARHFNRSVGAVRARACKEGISLTEKSDKAPAQPPPSSPLHL
jgi:hypothetical protein